MVRSQLLQMSVCVWITACTAVNDGLARAWRDGDRRGLSCAPCVVRSAADGSNRLAYDVRNGLEVLIEVHDDESALLAVAAMSRSGSDGARWLPRVEHSPHLDGSVLSGGVACSAGIKAPGQLADAGIERRRRRVVVPGAASPAAAARRPRRPTRRPRWPKRGG